MIDPWATTLYEDYGKLMDDFGISKFDSSHLPKPAPIFRRGIIFGHRDFERIRNTYERGMRFAILTGLMPSGMMHLGHKMVIDQVIYFQGLGADVTLAVADIEAYATRDISFEKGRRIAIDEYIPNYIALGLKPQMCSIYFQSKRVEVKDLAYILGKKINLSTMRAIYGMEDNTNMSHIFSPLVQVGDILHVQLDKFGGPRPTLVPVGVDQDPHIRLTRDIAASYRICSVQMTNEGYVAVFIKRDENVSRYIDMAISSAESLGFEKFERNDRYKALYILDSEEKDLIKIDDAMINWEETINPYTFYLPSSTYHRFMTGLTGEKMSSSHPESAIFLSDTSEDVKKKVMIAKTGGGVSVEEHRKNGGKPEICSVYELYVYHLVEDDSYLQSIYDSCREGRRLCGQCKKEATSLLIQFLDDLREKRESAKEYIDDYLSEY